MATWHTHAEPGVCTQICPVTQDVSNRYHTPVAAAPRAMTLFVESPGNEADAQALLVVEPEHESDECGFIRYGLEAPFGANAVAVRRPAEYFALYCLLAHRCANTLACSLGGIARTPRCDERFSGARLPVEG